jgi:hypothetical protein
MNPVRTDAKEGCKLSSGVLCLGDFSGPTIGLIKLNNLVEVIVLYFNITFNL